MFIFINEPDNSPSPMKIEVVMIKLAIFTPG